MSGDYLKKIWRLFDTVICWFYGTFYLRVTSFILRDTNFYHIITT